MALIDNLQSYWKFDEVSGTTTYDSIGSIDGTLSGGTLGNTGIINNCWKNTSWTGGGINFGDNYSFEYNDSFSYNLWYNLLQHSTNSQWQLLFTKQIYGLPSTGIDCHLRNDKIYFYLVNYVSGGGQSEIGVYTTETVSINEWQMVTITYDGSGVASGVKIYLNSNECTINVQYNDLAGHSIVNTQPLVFASANNDAGNFTLNGSLDEVGIWDKVLTQEEVLSLWNNGNGLPLTGFTGTTCTIPPSGLTVVLSGNCEMVFNWTNNCVYEAILLQNQGSWNTIATLAGSATTYTWTGTPTSNIFRVIGVIYSTQYASDSVIGEVPPALNHVTVKNAQCGPFDYSSGRIIYYLDYLLTGHTYTLNIYDSNSELYLTQSGLTSSDTFFGDNMPDGCYTAEILDETCGCTVDIESECVESLTPFSLGGIKKLYLAAWNDDLDYNYWNTQDEDYYIESEDTSFFTSTKIKEYLSLTSGTTGVTWYSIPVLPKIVSLSQKLEKVRQGYIFTDTLTVGVAKATAAKWLKMKDILNPEDKWIFIVQDADNFWWTGGAQFGAKISAYQFKTGARGEDDGYNFTFTAISNNKLLTAIDEDYVNTYVR